jgi:hypothetical protein
MNPTGDLAIIAESEALPPGNPSNDDLVLWDLSNPAVPRVMQKFSGVVKWLQDERNFIYVLMGKDYGWFQRQRTARLSKVSPPTATEREEWH